MGWNRIRYVVGYDIFSDKIINYGDCGNMGFFSQDIFPDLILKLLGYCGAEPGSIKKLHTYV